MSKQVVLGIIALIGLGALSWSTQAGERTGNYRLAAAANSPTPDRVRLFGVRTLSSKTYSRVTIDLSHEVRYATHRLAGNPARGLPPRIYIDLFNVKLAMDSKGPIVVEDGLLRQVRVSEFNPGAARVVIDMTNLREHNVFLLPDPYRLVIDIQGQKTGGAVAAIEKGQRRAPAPAVKANQNHGPAIRKIVLDPGHGGKDPGAISSSGIAEKDIVLAVAKKLATKLRQEMGATVVLTRTDDRFIPLEERTAIANAEEADLFISLHMNASPNPESRGLETYYLDNTNDEASIRLAARENGTSRKQISDLQFILSDMIQNMKLEDSINLAHRLHHSLVANLSNGFTEVKDLGVKKALFYVLVGARMPSVLVEMFFISNKDEAHAMSQEGYQATVVDALFDGILRYNKTTLAGKTL